jgi:polyhydroxybutyrate depolymerase
MPSARSQPNPGRSSIAAFSVLCMLLVSACNDSNNSNAANVSEPIVNGILPGCADTASCPSTPTLQIGKDRVAQVQIPSDYTTKTRYPLIIVLHGLGGEGYATSRYLGLDSRVDSKQYVFVVPEGTKNANGQNFWNATPACCAASRQDLHVDDVAYIRSLIEAAAANYSIDTRRIGLIGHSNGGFMALRMACEASDLVTSVVSLAGSTFADDASCTPTTKPVSVLALHGDTDTRIRYDGGQAGPVTYPGAKETIRRFAAHAGCVSSNPEIAPSLDVVETVAGNIDSAETTVLEYPDCAEGVDVALWTIVGAGHGPGPWVPSALDAVVDWIIEHPRS